MILVDANLLLYAHVCGFEQHGAARRWLDEQLGGTNRVALPWPSLLAFARLVTNPRVFERPETMAKAWRQIMEWLAAPPVWIPSPTDDHAAVLSRLISHCTRSALIHDAHLAALAMEHGLILMSTDGDFARLPDLRWQNPLAE